MLERVLVLLMGGDPTWFKRYGGEDELLLRLPQPYSYFGSLQEMGVKVSVRSIGGVIAPGRKGAKPSGWWKPYLSLVRASCWLSKYDAVITWGTGGALFADVAAILTRQSRKIVIILYANANYPGTRGKLSNRVRQILYRRMLQGSGRVLFTTHRQVDEAITKFGGEPGRVAHLPHGVDTRFFAPSPAYADASVREELRGLNTQKYVVVAGENLRQEHLIARVLEGLDIGLVRLTQNKYTEQLWREWVQRKSVSFPVLCIARLSPHEVRYVYQRALCLLNLVDSSWQPAGWTVMTEAMACGLPVIVNRGLTTEEMRTYTTPPCPLPFLEIEHLDPLEARSRLHELVESAEKRRQIGLLAREFVERHFNIEKTAKIAYRILYHMVAEYQGQVAPGI